METLLQTLKSIVLLPVGALLYLPFLRVAARLMALKRLSFGGAFLLALILGAVLLGADLAISPFLPDQGTTAILVSAAVSIAVSSGICGYFVTTAEGRSVGVLKGFLFTLLSQVLLTAALLVVAAPLVLISGAWKA
jgi:hypothetical protein